MMKVKRKSTTDKSKSKTVKLKSKSKSKTNKNKKSKSTPTKRETKTTTRRKSTKINWGVPTYHSDSDPDYVVEDEPLPKSSPINLGIPPDEDPTYSFTDDDDHDSDIETDIERNSFPTARNPLLMELVLEIVLRHLNKSEWMQIRPVCRFWNEEIVNKLLKWKYRVMDFNNKRVESSTRTRTGRTSEEIRIIESVEKSKHPELLRAVNVENWKTLSIAGQKFLQRHGHNLQQLNFGLSKTPIYEFNGLRHLLTTHCLNLTRLYVYENKHNYWEMGEGNLIPAGFNLNLKELILHFKDLQALPAFSEEFLLSILKASNNLKSLDLKYPFPTSMLKDISNEKEYEHVLNNLDKLTFHCAQHSQRFLHVFANMKFLKLRVLRLSDVAIDINLWETLLKNMGSTLKKLKVSNIKVNNKNSAHPHCIINTLLMLPGLEALNWGTGDKKMFSYLQGSPVVHEKLTTLKMDCLELWASVSVVTRESARNKISLLIHLFPRLKKLDLYPGNLCTRRDPGYGLENLQVMREVAFTHGISFITYLGANNGPGNGKAVNFDYDSETEID